MVYLGGLEGKASACNAGDLGSIPESGRSPGEGNGTPLQYSCLENPMDGGAWEAAVHGVAKSRTQLKRLSSSSNRDLVKKIADIKRTFHARMGRIKDRNGKDLTEAEAEAD